MSPPAPVLLPQTPEEPPPASASDAEGVSSTTGDVDSDAGGASSASSTTGDADSDAGGASSASSTTGDVDSDAEEASSTTGDADSDAGGASSASSTTGDVDSDAEEASSTTGDDASDPGGVSSTTRDVASASVDFSDFFSFVLFFLKTIWTACFCGVLFKSVENRIKKHNYRISEYYFQILCNGKFQNTYSH
jgi:hypothetical protein